MIDEAKRVRAMPIQDVVACPEWQAVRRSLVGKWTRQHVENVAALRAYLYLHPDDPAAIRRVLNVLTGSVHRAGHTRGQAATDQLRLEVRRTWATMLGKDPSTAKGAV